MFQVPSTITKITTMGDRSIRLQVDVDRELNASENGLIFSLYNKSGWLVFKETEIKPDDVEIPDYIKEFKTDKSPSQRLRSVIYLAWEKEGKQGIFDDYYKRKMEQIIEHFKGKLE